MSKKRARTRRPPRQTARPQLVASDRADGSLGEWLTFLGAMPGDVDWIPVWPPDAFAVAAALLRRTGAYVGLVNGTHPATPSKSGGRDPLAVGKDWRAALDKTLRDGSSRLRDACPGDIKQWWAHMLRCRTTMIADCANDAALISAAVNLCIASDAASDGIGLNVNATEDRFLLAVESVLGGNGRRSVCLHVSAEKLAVLPKRHTPQRGCTIRSLTHNLALFTPTEIRAFWEAPIETTADLDVFNLLLLPWPTDVRSADFRLGAVHGKTGVGAGLAVNQRYFDYLPDHVESPARLAARVEHALDVATAEAADRIHGIAFPELSLTEDQFFAAEEVAVKHRAILIAGLRGTATSQTNGMPFNACAIQPLGLTSLRDLPGAQKPGEIWDAMRKVQHKHHRWCLDRDQILQYELGGRLPASRDCWERIFIGPREIRFHTFLSWLTTCVLICEDLARQDPVTEVIRAVGPNLVFALLMDGPQLRNRWPSRYASVLAEDPGCSVLSMTSLGMSKRSKPRQDSNAAVNKNSTIALWRDAIYGEREISLTEGHDACVLSLVSKASEEFTIDGRVGTKPASFPVFAGSFSFSSVPPPGRRRETRYTKRRNA